MLGSAFCPHAQDDKPGIISQVSMWNLPNNFGMDLDILSSNKDEIIDAQNQLTKLAL